VAYPVYSEQFIAVRGLQQELYVDVAPDTLHVIRDVCVYFGQGGLNGKQFFLEIGPAYLAAVAWFQLPEENPVANHWSGRIVVPGGNTWGVRSTMEPCDVIVSGYLLHATSPAL
jgi:hypothetical protein